MKITGEILQEVVVQDDKIVDLAGNTWDSSSMSITDNGGGSI